MEFRIANECHKIIVFNETFMYTVSKYSKFRKINPSNFQKEITD